MGYDKPDVSIVIPVYNSSGCLSELVRQLTKELEHLGNSYEVILVEDASPDNSWAVITELVPHYPHVSAIRLMRNVGQARATLCGLAQARGGIVVTMDDDLQHRPNQLPKLLETLDTRPDIDCVFGVFKRKRHSAYRNLGSRVIRRLNSHGSGLPADTDYSSFRAMRRKVAEAILAHNTQNPVISYLIFSVTSHTTAISVEHDDRYSGLSNYTLGKQLRLALDNITNVSMLPLRAVSVMGFGACFLSLILVCVVMIRYFYHQITVPGWTTVIILISFFSGTILLSLGIIGEYLVRVLREVRGSPTYLVRERIGIDKTDIEDVAINQRRVSSQWVTP